MIWNDLSAFEIRHFKIIAQFNDDNEHSCKEGYYLNCWKHFVMNTRENTTEYRQYFIWIIDW